MSALPKLPNRDRSPGSSDAPDVPSMRDSALIIHRIPNGPNLILL